MSKIEDLSRACATAREYYRVVVGSGKGEHAVFRSLELSDCRLFVEAFGEGWEYRQCIVRRAKRKFDLRVVIQAVAADGPALTVREVTE